MTPTNVLFTDGSARTLADAGKRLRKECLRICELNRYDTDGRVLCQIDMVRKNKFPYSVYFDPLYAQD